MDFKVNANAQVKVKLTDLGVALLKDKHDELNAHIKSRGGIGFGEFVLRLDSEGYYTTQLWTLMQDFGPYMSIGSEPPFSLDIIITNGEPA